jgi:hypothetical protein
MSNRRMSACPVPDSRPGWRILALSVVLLSGCSTADFDRLPKELGGLPADAPQRPAQAPPFPGVYETPPPRSAALLDAEQQKRLEADLVAVRNRAARAQKAALKEAAKAEPKVKPRPEKPKPAKRPQGEAFAPRGGSGQAASGGPPWPVPSQTTGGSARP